MTKQKFANIFAFISKCQYHLERVQCFKRTNGYPYSNETLLSILELLFLEKYSIIVKELKSLFLKME